MLSIKRKKLSIVPVYIPSPCNVFLYFLGGQVHKDSKLGVMTNVGKNRRDRRDNKVITILYDRFLFTEM